MGLGLWWETAALPPHCPPQLGYFVPISSQSAQPLAGPTLDANIDSPCYILSQGPSSSKILAANSLPFWLKKMRGAFVVHEVESPSMEQAGCLVSWYHFRGDSLGCTHAFVQIMDVEVDPGDLRLNKIVAFTGRNRATVKRPGLWEGGHFCARIYFLSPNYTVKCQRCCCPGQVNLFALHFLIFWNENNDLTATKLAGLLWRGMELNDINNKS